ncbi:MAG TPA: rhodanese-like domain-containing protein [Thermoanaerobaculia bacterium]|nr:rhodanese-like domain-containing protein [Thermoanaerobaculia bacterium]
MKTITALTLALFAATAFGQMKAPKDSVKVTRGDSALQPVKPKPIESAKRISKTEAQRLVKQGKAVFIDVRSKESYDAGHIQGAMSIPASQLRYRFSELPPGKMLITYCA